MKDISSSELVGIVLTYWANQQTKQEDGLIPYHRETIHRAVYELQQEYQEIFPCLERLHFGLAGVFPYSHDLTRDIDILLQSGMLAIVNITSGGQTDQYLSRTWAPDTQACLNEWMEKHLTTVADAEAFYDFAEQLGKKLTAKRETPTCTTAT